MFEEILGIPAHPLLVHGAVVFVPLQVLAAIAYAVVPFLRRYIWWAVLALAVVAPLTAWSAKLSGDAFRNRMINRGTASGQFLDAINAHGSFGLMTAYLSTGLGVLMLLLVLVIAKRPRDVAASSTGGSAVVTWVSALVVVAVSAATAYYVFRTGDTGAHNVWSNS